MKKRFVIDTNVFVSFLLFKRSTPRQAVYKAKAEGELLLSEDLFLELSKILDKEKFDKYVSHVARSLFLDDLKEEGVFVQVHEKFTVCRDPKDDMILELAVCGKADCIISGDKDLLTLKSFRGIPIVTPEEFLREF